MTTEKTLRYAQFRTDGYWYPVNVLDREGGKLLVEVISPRRGRRRHKWVWPEKIFEQRPVKIG